MTKFKDKHKQIWVGGYNVFRVLDNIKKKRKKNGN